MGDSPKWVKSKKRRKREKERKRERKRERLNDGDNNGQATHCNATSCGARKAAWAKKYFDLQDRSECLVKGQWCQRASIAVNGMVRAASRSEKARFRIKMFLVL